MALVPFSKPHATSTAWVAHLRNAGLLVPKPGQASKQLDLIGYYRLRIYFLSRRQVNNPGKPFSTGVKFNDIMQIYKCDEALRQLCFKYVAVFEIAFRNCFSEEISRRFGSHPYDEISAFKDAAARKAAMKMIAEIYQRSKDARMQHYMTKYNPTIPPIWTMKEAMTFGASDRFFDLLSGSIQNSVRASFGLPTLVIFRNWIGCLVDLRNACAHHDRIFNRSFQKQPSTLNRPVGNVPVAPKPKLKALLECLDYMLQSRGVKSNIVNEARAIIKKYPAVVPSEVGF